MNTPTSRVLTRTLLTRSLLALPVAAAALALAAFAYSGPTAAAAASTASAAAAAATTYKVDAAHASVAFKIQHNYASHTWGLFTAVSGTFTLDGDTGSLDIAVNADSLNTGNAKRDEHIRGNDFFAAKQFPKITFKSKSFTKSADGYQVTGDLTLKGVTKEITVPLTVTDEKQGVAKNTLRGVETSFTIKRSDYGIKTYVGPVGDEVTLFVSLEVEK